MFVGYVCKSAVCVCLLLSICGAYIFCVCALGLMFVLFGLWIVAALIISSILRMTDSSGPLRVIYFTISVYILLTVVCVCVYGCVSVCVCMYVVSRSVYVC